MKQRYKILISSLLCLVVATGLLNAQTSIKGKVRDVESGDPIIGATIVVVGATGGTLTNYDGEFSLKAETLPTTIKVSYTGYESKEMLVSSAEDRLDIRLGSSSIIMEEARITHKDMQGI